MREIFQNIPASTTLAEPLDTVETAIDVVDGSIFPATGDFRLRVDDELMLATARATNTLTVVRGVEGTTAATHSNGANIRHVGTAGGMLRWARDNSPYWDTDTPPLRLDVVASDFSWVNQGTERYHWACVLASDISRFGFGADGMCRTVGDQYLFTGVCAGDQ